MRRRVRDCNGRRAYAEMRQGWMPDGRDVAHAARCAAREPGDGRSAAGAPKELPTDGAYRPKRSPAREKGSQLSK
jgi:hypothetical protein